MPIHPIEYRYGTSEMKDIWSEENKLQYVLEVERALAKAEADLGMIPKRAAKSICKATEKVTLSRIKEIEDEIHHDMMAIVRAISEKTDLEDDYVHCGATSNDILDTSLALQFRDALKILELKLVRLLKVLVIQADKHKTLVCAGRTHGQIAIPTTYGLRFAIWAKETERHLLRLGQLYSRVVVGQLTGAVGTQAAFGKRGLEVQEKMMASLEIGHVEVSSQVIQRDRHAEYVMFLANVATTLDKICVEIRTLQRSEIAEVSETFGRRQIGSSTMPHKRNPIRSEQVCGLARVIRAYVLPAVENNTLWDERDLTNSSCERVIIPEATILTDHILTLSINIIGNLQLDKNNIEKNLKLMRGLNMGEAVMIYLAKKIGRQRAHEIIRAATLKAYESGENLVEALSKEPMVVEYLSAEQIAWMMRPENYIGTAVEQVEQVVSKLRSAYCQE
jgi:adenylosuccinate lyase